jgi:hypothetical protein
VPEADAGEEIGVRDQDLPFRDADAGEIGGLDVAPVAQVVADRELRGLRARALGRDEVGEQRHVARAELDQLVQRPQPLHRPAPRSTATSGPRTRTAKSTRGGRWPGVFMSSIRLMPPTNATRVSTWQSFRCSRRSRCDRKCQGCTSGRYLSRLTPPDEQPLEALRQVVLRAPAVDQHAHRDAARRSAHQRLGDRAPGGSSAKM